MLPVFLELFDGFDGLVDDAAESRPDESVVHARRADAGSSEALPTGSSRRSDSAWLTPQVMVDEAPSCHISGNTESP